MNGVESLLDHRKLIPTHRPIHVLVVDDYRDNAESMATLLRLDGMKLKLPLTVQWHYKPHKLSGQT